MISTHIISTEKQRSTLDVNLCDPVFVTGMNGSGTTLVLRILDRHPNLYAFPMETKIMPHFILTLNRYGDLNVDDNFLRLWNDIRSSPCFRFANKRIAPPLPENWQEFPRNLSTIFDSVFGFFALKEGKHRWCEKTPMHALHITLLAKIFPDASFVHVIRDGRDCAASFHRRWRNTPECTIYRWKNLVCKARSEGSMLGERYFQIRYEKLTTAPEKQVRRLCSFLGLEYKDDLLKSAQGNHKASRTLTGNGPIFTNTGKWRIYFDDKQVRRLERIAGSTLSSLGYSVKYPEYSTSDRDMPRLIMRFWLYRDRFYYVLRALAKNAFSKISTPWWRFPQFLKQSYKQWRSTRL